MNETATAILHTKEEVMVTVDEVNVLTFQSAEKFFEEDEFIRYVNNAAEAYFFVYVESLQECFNGRNVFAHELR